jgi:C-terminal processing protease CtpA/Prc
LPGNIGYIDLREFMPADFAARRYASAMELVSGASGLIVDLRQNVGGDPHTVALFLSYFFAENDGRHLNDIYWRKDGTTDQFWTFPVVGPRYAGPVYVLTSPHTFSGGEECAYDFQTQKRATLVGAVTGGGANPGGPIALVHGFVAGVPSGRAINPVTKTNWEHVGVKPDKAVAPADALKVAYKALLSDQIQTAKSPREKSKAQALMARVDSGDWDAADYTPINAD